MAEESDKEKAGGKSSEKPFVPRSATEIQKMKLEKLMRDPVSYNTIIQIMTWRKVLMKKEFSWEDNISLVFMLSIDRTNQCQFLNFRSSGNHQKPPNSFDLWWVSFCRYHKYRRSYALYLKLKAKLNRYDELTVSTPLSTSSVPLSLLREVGNCWLVRNTMEIF